MDFLTPEALTTLGQVILIDLVLAGDNAVVIGLAAAGVPKPRRGRAILIGIAAAMIVRITLALAATAMMGIRGLLLVGGLLLLWICWRMARELRAVRGAPDRPPARPGDAPAEASSARAAPGPKSLRAAVVQIIIADVSMSLDNVLAVAGAAREHPTVLVIGLTISVALMGAAATFIARLLNRHRWIAWIGLLIILYVAVKMVWSGAHEVVPYWRA